jgi:hypothetical protein
MKCVNCGNELSGNERFCPCCGASLIKYCPKCGSPVKPLEKFCGQCGAVLDLSDAIKADEAETEDSMETDVAVDEAMADEVYVDDVTVDDTTVDDVNLDDIERSIPDVGTASQVGIPETVTVNAQSNDQGDWIKVSQKEIIGKKAEYYQAQFEAIASGKKGKIKWASVILGLIHAAYRNVWKEWLLGPGIPLIVAAVAGAAGGFAVIATGNYELLLPIGAIMGLAHVIGLILQIWFGCRFNQIYSKHVDEKIRKKNYKPDPSVLRAILVSVIFAGIIGACEGVYTSASMSSMLSMLFMMDDDTDDDMDDDEVQKLLDEIVTEETEVVSENIETDDVSTYFLASSDDVKKFISHEGLMKESDGSYANGDITIQLDDDGSILAVELSNDRYSMYKLKTGERFSDNKEKELTKRTYALFWDDVDIKVYAKQRNNGRISEVYVGLDESGKINELCYILDTENMDAFNNIIGADDYYPASAYYILQSDTTYYTAADLAGMSKDMLRLARNEIYARHGRKFDSADLQEYFNQQPWYNGYIEPKDFNESVLNACEKANLDVIKQVENTK